MERVDIPRSVAKGPFSARKSVCCKDPYRLEIGPSVRAQILAQKDQPNPISFTTSDGIKGRVWLGVGAPCVQGKGGSQRIIGNDLHWGMTVKKAFEVEQTAMQRERRRWPVDIMGGNRRGKIDPRCLKESWKLSAFCFQKVRRRPFKLMTAAPWNMLMTAIRSCPRVLIDALCN